MIFPKALVRIFIVSIVLITSSFLYNRGNAHSSPQLESNTSIAVILDLGGVVFDTDVVRSFWALGPSAIYWYWKENKIGMKALKKKFFEILNKISDSIGNPDNAKDEEGNLLPLLFCEWLTGHKSGKKLQKHFCNALEKHPEWCTSLTERKLLIRLAHLIFNPKLFSDSRKLNPDAVSFVKECKNRGYKLYILSNWDPASFEHLISRFSDFFSNFDGFFISGYTKKLKPNKDSYHYFTQQAGVTWVFVDDQKHNVEEAQKCGIYGIHCEQQKGFLRSKPNFSHVRKKLHSIEDSLRIGLMI